MKRILVVATLVALLLPAIVMAEGELTLEGLAEIVESLTERTHGIEKRLEDLESMFVDEGPIEMYGNGCLVALEPTSAELQDLNSLRDEAVLGYKQKFDEWLVLSTVEIHSVLYNSETDHIGIVYKAPNDRFMVEEWNGCELIQASDWWEE